MPLLFDPAKVRAAQEAHRAFRLRSDEEGRMAYGSPEHQGFLRAAGAAWPERFAADLARPDAVGLDTALRFLEEDPFFFRTGYAKAEVLRRLSRWPLDCAARRRIAHIVLRAMDGPPRREFRWQAKAAAHADRAILVPGLLRCLDKGGPASWQAFCAAHCLLGLGFPNWEQRRRLAPKPQIEAICELLRALPEAR